MEANCNPNGIGLVKLFGRSSGYVAMFATLAARDVNICLIPEVLFNLYGENGLLDYIFKRIEIKHHAVIVVGEGAGFAVKDYNVEVSGKTDKSGNPVLPDIGVLLREEIKKKGQKAGMEINLKYIDPTYIVRAGRRIVLIAITVLNLRKMRFIVRSRDTLILVLVLLIIIPA